MIKISRDAQLDIDSDLSKYARKYQQVLRRKASREPVRFIYDQLIEADTLAFP
jgi:polyphosphate kinase